MKNYLGSIDIKLKSNKNIFLLYDKENNLYVPFYYLIKIIMLYVTDFKFNNDNDIDINDIYRNNFKIIKYKKTLKNDNFKIIKENLNDNLNNFINIDFLIKNNVFIINNISNILRILNYKDYNFFHIYSIYDNLLKYLLTESFKFFTINNIKINEKYNLYGFGNLLTPYFIKSKTDKNINEKVIKKFFEKNIIIDKKRLNIKDDYDIKFLNLDYNKIYIITNSLLNFIMKYSILSFNNICLLNSNNRLGNNIFMGKNTTNENIYYNVKEKKLEYVTGLNDKKTKIYENKIYHPICICK